MYFPRCLAALFATAVLNINNIRDIESDRKAGKLSIPVRLGKTLAVRYHWILIDSRHQLFNYFCALVLFLPMAMAFPNYHPNAVCKWKGCPIEN